MRFNIWGEKIPGNSPKRKYDVMDIQRDTTLEQAEREFVRVVPMEAFAEAKTIIDTYTWHRELKTGLMKDTFEDEPCLIPYVAERSKKAVIVVPGGGLTYLSMDAEPEGLQREGDLVAKALNEHGISAFVLWYRVNPYRNPTAFMDLQRAIRYVRYHAGEYGIDPEQIGAVGFSGGGFLVSNMHHVFEGKEMFPQGYVHDEVDQVSDVLNFVALVYPSLRFKHIGSVMYACFDKEIVQNPRLCEAYAKEYDCLENMQVRKTPYFINCGTEDELISTEDIHQYVKNIKESGGNITEIWAEGATHGYGADPEEMKKYGYWLEAFLKWCEQIS